MNRDALGRRLRPWGMPIGALLLLTALAAWAFASPVGSSPDEDYHLVSIWCGGGIDEGVCDEGTGDGERQVAPALVGSTCYAFEPTLSAGCQERVPSLADQEQVLSDRGNFAGSYPPVFYAVMSVFAGDDLARSVVIMRLVNALLFVGLGAWTYALSAPRLRRGLVGGALVTLVPLGTFIVPSLNPSSWAVISAVVLFISLVGFMTTTGTRRMLGHGAVAALAVVLGAGARADSAMYATLAVCAALTCTVVRRRESLLRAVYPLLLGAAAAGSYLSSGQSDAVTSEASGAFQLSLAAGILVDVPTLWVGALGGAGLGWLDTAMPTLVVPLTVGAAAAAVVIGLGKVQLRRGLALLGIGLAAWVVPAYVQYLSGQPVGAYVQPRYVYPLVILFVIIAVLRVGRGEAGGTWTRTQRILLALALGAANAGALHANLRRYVTGVDVGGLNLDSTIEWWWSLPISPMGLWALGSAAFLGAVLLLTREMEERGATVPDSEGRPATEDEPHPVRG
ncbi:DUF2142 domain-containing protein [Actinotalea sp. BY-33]|uniref:DUF2142 domain-containing protein n=1 Tax=Actinotalea soli TaxID=2819234 RepID=A0A939RUS8_9CELL|nr:DUF2142 domain-containing protein [Actinotalea soli]MBO1750938.1 DUF2142 domain-containing protein [Actinotalea soli]